MADIAEIAQQRTVRLIPTCYYKPPVLKALVDTEAELRILEELEGQTSVRTIHGSLLGDFEGWGRSHIDAAFLYTRAGGSRFNGEERGAWYAGFDDQTALEEVAFHRTRELSFVNVYEDEAVYHALHASFIGRFHDIRAYNQGDGCLHPDTGVGYVQGQQLAAALVADGSRGLIYPSVRFPGGICIAAFQPHAVQDVSPGARWKIEWTGSPQWSATAH